MKKKIAYSVVVGLCFLLALSACSEKKRVQRSRPGLRDSVYSVQAAMAIYDTLPDRALTILDSARLLGNIPDFTADLYRARVYNASLNGQRQDSAFVICQTLLQHDSVVHNPQYRQDVLELLVNSARMREDYGQLVNYAMPLTELLREQGLTTEALRTEAEIGLALTHLGQEEEGMAKIDDAISRLDGVRRFNELDATIIAMRRKVNVLFDQGRYREVLSMARRIQERLDDYEKNPSVYHDDTYREPSEEDRPGYISFYSSNATFYKARAYVGLGNEDAANAALNAFRKTDYSRTMSGRLMMASLLGKLGDYDDMLSIYDDAEQYMIAEGDTLSDSYIMIVRDRAIAAAAKGQTQASQEMWLRYDNLQRTLDDSLQRSKAHLYAAIYRAQEQQMEIQNQKEKSTRNAYLAGILLLLSLVSLGFAFYALLQWRVNAKRNKVLADQISDAISYKDKFKELEDKSASDNALPPSVDNMDNIELFNHISKIIVNEGLYLNPMFSRQTLVDRLGVSTHRIGAAFSQGSTYTALPDYIRQLRLEHACRLLTMDQSMSIKAVGEASGFSNNSTFCSDFKKHYGMTPTVYRSLRSRQPRQ